MILLQIDYRVCQWKKVWKSVNIWWSYGQEFGVLFFFDSQCISYIFQFADTHILLCLRRTWPGVKQKLNIYNSELMKTTWNSTRPNQSKWSPVPRGVRGQSVQPPLSCLGIERVTRHAVLGVATSTAYFHLMPAWWRYCTHWESIMAHHKRLYRTSSSLGHATQQTRRNSTRSWLTANASATVTLCFRW